MTRPDKTGLLDGIPCRLRLRSALMLVISCLQSSTGDAQQVDFNRDIRSLLSNNCLMCHGPDDKARSTDLRLDTQEGSRIDLGGYAAIVPGDPDNSELLVRLTTSDPDLRMPPEGKGRRLTEEEVDRIRRWIQQGGDFAKHWAYEVPERGDLPTVQQTQWPRTPIDTFILARLEKEGLAPSPQADRYTLARRVAIDLTGLPPTWEQVEGFVNDPRPDAYAAYVDQLLKSPAFGERWARVWLDLARYADSAGYADDPPRTIWAYRDYVIRSLNANKPFDQFTIEQIAGDLLPDPTDEQLIATAFHRNTLTNNEGGTNDEEFRNVAVVDRVNTTMAVWMGTTMGCAQCHSHKYDPITQEDYYRFFAIFNNTEDADVRDERPLLELWSEEQNEQKKRLSETIAALKERLETNTPELEAAQGAWLAEMKHPPAWEPFVPESATSKHLKLEIDPDGWLKAVGEKPLNDEYTLDIPTSGQQMTGLRVEVSDRQTSNFVLTNVQATWIPKDSQAAKARYVRIELPGPNKMIHLAEVEVFSGGKNIAGEGTASQSSTDYNGPAERAIDGNTNGEFSKNSVTHTAVQSDPWWELDLKSTAPVERIVLWNRTDGGDSISDRIKGYRLVLLDEQRRPVWEHLPEQLPKPSHTVSPSGNIELRFQAALADFEQPGFPATSAIGDPTNKDKGWAIAGGVGQSHELTLVLDKPRVLDEGTLQVRLGHASVHGSHLLDHFRIGFSANDNLLRRGRMNRDIRALVQQDAAP
ncbi:MAG: DUF1549 domain-containing protein [Pirellulaceae bacterium]